MKKTTVLFILFLLFSLFKPSFASAQNKLGINIAIRYDEFDKAAQMVGPGGWIVILASPGNADGLKTILTSHPEVNIIIRGHCPSDPLGPNIEENKKFALSWTATLGTMETAGRKIFFMPWNEPNMTRECQGIGNDFDANNTQCAPYVTQYINDLKRYLSEAGLLGTKIELLSPMINQHHANYRDFISALGGRAFFQQFYGVSMNLYDNESCGTPLCNSEAFRNAGKFNETLNEVGLGGMKIFAVETGLVNPQGAISDYPDFSDQSMNNLISQAYPLWQSAGNFIMFSPLSYNPETNDPSWIYGGATEKFYKSHKPSSGSAVQGYSPPSFLQWRNSQGLTVCPNSSTTYVLPGGHCEPCGGGGSVLQTCKPVPGSGFGNEYSEKNYDLREKATYSRDDEACLLADIQGILDINNLQIPLVKQMNQYYLGVENGQGLFSGQKQQEMGVLRLLLPKEQQDEIKKKFLEEIISRGVNSKYANFKVNGLNPNQIKIKFQEISIKKPSDRNEYDKGFLKNVWAKLPLFANEESEGEILFERTPGDPELSRVKTSVPEVYRLNKATELLARIIVPGFEKNVLSANVSQANDTKNNVLQAQDAQDYCVLTIGGITENTKKSLGGEGEKVCTTLEENIFNKTRGFQNDAQEGCQLLQGCNMENPKDRCCGYHGKCVDSEGDGVYSCSETCPGGENGYCIGPNGINSLRNCCVPERPLKTKEFEDSKLGILNKVPFLAKIEENTIGPKGLFKIFVSKADIPAVQTAFEDVAGKSESSVNLREPTITVKKGKNLFFGVNTQEEKINMLFYKLGTFLNVKNLVAGKILNPQRTQGTNDSSFSLLDYEIDHRNNEVAVSNETKLRIINQVLNSWPNSKIESSWDLVYNQVRNDGWNPAFVLALWIEESGASGVDAYDLGCLSGERNNIGSQLGCLFSRPYKNDNFANFMCMYSEGKLSPCSFEINPNFPGNLKSWYDKLIE